MNLVINRELQMLLQCYGISDVITYTSIKDDRQNRWVLCTQIEYAYVNILPQITQRNAQGCIISQRLQLNCVLL